MEKSFFLIVTPCGRARRKPPRAIFVTGGSFFWLRLVGRAGLGLLWLSLINGKSFLLIVTPCGHAQRKPPRAIFVPGGSFFWSHLVGRTGLRLLWASFVPGESFFGHTSWAAPGSGCYGLVSFQGKVFWSHLVGRAGLGVLLASFIPGEVLFHRNHLVHSYFCFK